MAAYEDLVGQKDFCCEISRGSLLPIYMIRAIPVKSIMGFGKEDTFFFGHSSRNNHRKL